MSTLQNSLSLILVRGLPGSGKTTFAKIAADQKAPVFSADDFWMHDGKYLFDATRLGEAHADCERRTAAEMFRCTPIIYVANTFTRKREMTAYFDLAAKYGYNVFTVIVENRHGSMNIHNVPIPTLVAMRERFEVIL